MRAKRTRTLRVILAANVAALMEAHPTLKTEKALRDASPLGGGTIDGIRRGSRNTGIDSLEALAMAYRLEPWQLLVPHFSWDKPPRLDTGSKREVLREAENRLSTSIGETLHRVMQDLSDYPDKK